MLATLSDGLKTTQFPVDPEKVSMSVSGDYAINSVLDTAKPQVRPKSSATTYTLNRILLYSFAGDVDHTETYTSFKDWADKQVRLKYTSDIFNIPSCYIRSLTMVPIRWLGTKLLQAEMTMELIEADDGSKPIKPVAVTKKLTAREQDNKVASVQKKLNTPTNQKRLALADGNFSVNVDDQDMVAINANGIVTTYEYDTLIKQLG